mmetsp:Transcript_17088/g.51069  ORF Transcript_17088/g.51069 Transcript_17088/m.51069 type:complete len:228 (-) Transcript_17088:4012-4695(-)
MFPEGGGNILSNIQGVFKKKPEPRELVRKWQGMLRTETRHLDTQIREISREEKMAQKQIKEAAKRGDMQSAKLLAREVVRTRKAVTQLYTNKAHMIAMGTQLQQQLAMVKVAGTLNKSSEVMKLVNDMMKASKLNQTMMEMSREMMKAGLIDEMMSDAIDDAVDGEDVEQETDAEVDKVLQEIAGDTMSQLADAPKARREQQQVTEEEEGEDAEDEDLRARLAAVRG